MARKGHGVSGVITGTTGNGYGYGVECRREDSTLYELHGVFFSCAAAEAHARALLLGKTAYQYIKVCRIETPLAECAFNRPAKAEKKGES